MTKKQTERYVQLRNTLLNLGLTDAEINALLRIEKTLTSWSVRECGDGSDWAIERDGADGVPYNVYHGPGESRRYRIADRERGALKRATAIAEAYGLTIYHQGDCRGCALYLMRPGDVPAGECVTGYYTRGIAICFD